MASNDFELPDNVPVTDSNGRTPVPWGQWFSRVHRIVLSAQASGATTNRPASMLWIGRTYFDTDLGIPVWVQSVKPTVWVDAVGNAV